MREHLETYLARAGCDDDLSPRVPPHVQQAFHAYLRCGILVRGFAQAYCHGCDHTNLTAIIRMSNGNQPIMCIRPLGSLSCHHPVVGKFGTFWGSNFCLERR